MIRYKKIISIAMSMVVMATAFSTNVFACPNNRCCVPRPNIIVNINNAGEIDLPDNYTGEGEPIIRGGNANDVITVNIGSRVSKLVGTFTDFTNLGTVNIPRDSKLKTIGEKAFKGCTDLTSITIPDSVTNIDKCAFLGCEKLTTVNIGIKSVNYFSDVFRNLNVDSVNIGDGATSIGKEAFKNCQKLTRVTIPNSVKTIDDRAFIKCTSLGEVTIRNKQQTNNTNANVLCKVGEMAFMGCKRLTEVDIPNSVTRIEMCAFLGCESLTKISIPDNVKTLEEFIFFNCNNLEEISLPSNKSLKTDEDSFAGIISKKRLKIFQRKK